MEKKKLSIANLQKALQHWNDLLVVAEAEGNKRQANAARMIIKRIQSDMKKTKAS